MPALAVERPSSLHADIKVIDADTHLSEPEDLWTSRAPAKYRDRVPQVATVNGRASWVLDGKHPIGHGASSTFHKDGRVSIGNEFASWRNADVIAASYDVAARLEMMDQAGIHAQIVYPNVVGFGGQNTAMVDPDLRLLSIQIYNDAMFELQANSQQRLYPMAALPWWDVKQAVSETQRAHANGLRGININSDPHKYADAEGNPLPDLRSRYWDPLWEICESLDMPINFHIGASEISTSWIENAAWPSLHEDAMGGAVIGSMLFVDNGRVMGNIIFSGLLDRFPRLKFVSVESGLGWIPFLMESFDYQFNYMPTPGRLQLNPSDYVRRNFYACFWFEKRDLSRLIADIGVDNCLFETDFPHPISLYPAPLEYIDEGLAQLDTSARRKIMGGNAARIYNIQL